MSRIGRDGSAGREVGELVRLLESFLPRVARIPGSSFSRQVQPGALYEFVRPSEALVRGYERLVEQGRSRLARVASIPPSRSRTPSAICACSKGRRRCRSCASSGTTRSC